MSWSTHTTAGLGTPQCLSPGSWDPDPGRDRTVCPKEGHPGSASVPPGPPWVSQPQAVPLPPRPCAPPKGTVADVEEQWKVLEESPMPDQRDWGCPTWNDSQEHHTEERMPFFPKKEKPGCPRRLRAAKSHLHPFRELGQEQETSASSFQTPADTLKMTRNRFRAVVSDVCCCCL